MTAPARRRLIEVWSHSKAAAIVDDGTAVYVLNLARLNADCIPRAFQGPAAEIWRRLDGANDLGSIAAGLADTFGVDATEVHSDLTAFVDQLAADGLVQLSVVSAR